MAAIPRVGTHHKLSYADTGHIYHLDGVRAKSVTAVAKIAADSYAIDQWEKRQVAIGLAVDANLLENAAANLDNKKALNKICDEAKTQARAHAAADRGSQMHRVLELVLTDREHKLVTDQQRTDAELLKRTLARYRLRAFDSMAEQFVIWPAYRVTGRFDAILEKPNGDLVLTDLKSGPNAVLYPHQTAVQLALYARAPLISDAIHVDGDSYTVTDWREMPARLERRYAYVLLAEPGAEIGTFYEMDIEHGWAAGRQALEIVNWRKRYDNGWSAEPRWGFIRPLAPPPPTVAERIAAAPNLETLRALWAEVNAAGALDAAARAAFLARVAKI